MPGEPEKRKAPSGEGEEPEAKRPAEAAAPAAAPAAACTWGSGGGGCTWGGGGGFGGVAASGASSFASAASSGPGATGGGFGSGGFASVGAAGTGFGAVTGGGFAAAAAAKDAPKFSGSTTFGEKASDNEAEEAEEAPTPVEAAATGEEDENCIHKVRAKLFHLEVRSSSPTKGASDGGSGAEAATNPADSAPSSSKPGTPPPPRPPAPSPAACEKEGEKEGEKAAGAKEGEADGGRDEARVAKPSTLNPNAAPFVPAPYAASAAAASSGDASEPATRWVERGVGSLRLLVPKAAAGEASAESYPRLVMRVEHVGRLILNEALRPETAPAERVTDTSIRLVVVGANAVPQSYLLRVKTPVEAGQLLRWVNATIPT